MRGGRLRRLWLNAVEWLLVWRRGGFEGAKQTFTSRSRCVCRGGETDIAKERARIRSHQILAIARLSMRYFNHKQSTHVLGTNGNSISGGCQRGRDATL